MDKIDPFLLFPEVAWEKILGKLEATDILAVFRAYPLLSGRVLKNNSSWLFELVIPEIYPYLKKQELLFCRQVCQRWRQGVDTYFEANPEKRAKESSRTVSCILCHGNFGCGQHWHFLYQGQGLYEFRNSQTIRSFIQDMGNLGQVRNPFIGRSIDIIYDHNMRPPVDLQSFPNDAMEFLLKFGSHIWHLSFTYLYVGELAHPHIFKFMVDCLGYLPNLKSLKIFIKHYGYGDPECVATEEVLTSHRKFIPQLPHLEAINFVGNDMIPGVLNALIRSYSQQVKKVTMSLRNWRSEYHNLLPNLMELNLCEATSMEEVTIMLVSLDAPKLEKLRIDLAMSHVEAIMTVRNIILALNRFPLLTSLILVPSHFLEDSGIPNTLAKKLGADLSPDEHNFPSVKLLEIWGNYPEENVSLLKCFPNVEMLKMVTGQHWMEKQISTAHKSHLVKGKSNKLCEKIYQPRVWELLPNLKKITMGTPVERWNPIKISYSRTHYEFLKGQGTFTNSENGFKRFFAPMRRWFREDGGVTWGPN